MKICQIIASRGEGGLEKHVRELSSELQRHGHDVVVFGEASYLRTLPEHLSKTEVNFGLSRHNPFLVLQLLNKLRRCKCDVIHAQANKAASLISMLRRWLPCPVVGTLHNIKRNTSMFLALDHIITVSRHLAEKLPAEKTTVIYNGISPPPCRPLKLMELFDLPAEQPFVCAAGRLVKAKGFDVLLEAVNGLPVNLLIVGEGPERQNLERQISGIRHPTRCLLLGHRNDIPGLLASSDAVVISSRREGFSYVFCEALFCESRVLSTDVPIPNELLPGALIVPTNDAASLRDRLQSMLQSPEKWSTLMREAHLFAKQNLTLNAMGKKTLAVYGQVVPAKEI
ncbi:MAG: glycosyltransferase family 4 protein [Thiobacillaceae bacterium]